LWFSISADGLSETLEFQGLALVDGLADVADDWLACLVGSAVGLDDLDGAFSMGPRFGSDKHGRVGIMPGGACQEKYIFKAQPNGLESAS
jgi:hypothetical protein